MATEYLSYLDMKYFLLMGYYFILKYDQTEYLILRMDFRSTIGLEIVTMLNKNTGERISYNGITEFAENVKISNNKLKDIWGNIEVLNYNQIKNPEEKINIEKIFLEFAVKELEKNGK